MTPGDTYQQGNQETPLEQGARTESEARTAAGQDLQIEHEADVVVGDVEDYVAETSPGDLPQAEAALDAWEIPTSPFEGVPGDVALNPDAEETPLVTVFSARTESEANIVRGLLESAGIAAIFRQVGFPTYGSVLSLGESRFADILVTPAEADEARAVIESAQQTPVPEDIADAVADEDNTDTPRGG
jgi:hypothetical protein